MGVATVVFWLGRNEFAHIPAEPGRFVRELVQPAFRRSLAGLLVLYVLIAAFWSVFDQTASRWVAQAEKMDRVLWGWEVLPSQMQSLNSILVLVLIPLFTLVIYPQVGKVIQLTAMRRIGAGLVVTMGAVAMSWWIERGLAAGETLHIGWQGVAYLLMTTAEILISITVLEFSYTQAPPRLKSFIMALYLLSVGLPDVLQLAGGILNYFDLTDGRNYLGSCFVFDEREALARHVRRRAHADGDARERRRGAPDPRGDGHGRVAHGQRGQAVGEEARVGA
jgi:POT family proton-dependent oligopeptide transporter